MQHAKDIVKLLTEVEEGLSEENIFLEVNLMACAWAVALCQGTPTRVIHIDKSMEKGEFAPIVLRINALGRYLSESGSEYSTADLWDAFNEGAFITAYVNNRTLN